MSESTNIDWRRPLDCPKCKGIKTYQEGYCDKCNYDITLDIKCDKDE